MIRKNTTKTPKGKKTQVTVYEPISHHIYWDGYSYRVRACINGTHYTQNFPSKNKAMKFRKELLNNVR